MYQVVGKNGEIYGPVSLPELKQWAAEGRLDPQMMMIDPISGVSRRAEQMLEEHNVFPKAVPPVLSVTQSEQMVVSGPVYVAAPTSAAGVPIPAGQLQPASLGLRLIALLIDGLCAIPLAVASAIPFVGLAFAPLLCLYWLSRDSFFNGQSVGKRVMGIRVVREDRQPFTWGNSATRNIIYLTTLIMMIPFLGDALAIWFVGLPALVEILMVLITHKRIGDSLGHTLVIVA